MPLEMEAKLKVERLEPTRLRLQQGGALRVGNHLETNALYDTVDAMLEKADQGLRVRVRRDLENGSEDAILTFKGPGLPGAYKNREEIETHVADPKAMAALLNALGYRQSFSFQKKRESWEWEGCHVELDEVPHLGCFVEIEGADEAAILEVQQKLGLAGIESLKISYIGLLLKWMEKKGRDERTIIFPGSRVDPS